MRQTSPRGQTIQRVITKRFRSSLWLPFTRALRDYHLVENGDHIAVCVSGGKDSMLMALLLQEFCRHRWLDLTLEFLVMDPGYDDASMRLVMDNAELLGIPVRVEHTRIFDIVAKAGDDPCYPCARMRRGALYDFAKDLGCNKIALGHHYDDVIETILMNVLYGGQVKTMMPKLRSTNHPGMELIRPLYLVREADIVCWRDTCGLRFIHCACPLADARGEAGSTRDETKSLIRQLVAKNPQVAHSIFHSADNIKLDAVTGFSWGGAQHSFLEWYDDARG